MADHQKLHAFRLGTFPALIAMAGACTCPAGLPAILSPDPQDDASSLSRSFRCPEQIPSNEEKQTAVREFLQTYAKAFPNHIVGDMRMFRYRLLVTHSCSETLNFMLTNVSPTSEMLRAEARDFGPKTQEFNSSTKVWTVRFTKDGAPAALSEEDLIFNFYGWNPATSPEVVAKAFVIPRENLRILGSFEAPDDITKAPAYFVISETLYQGKTYGYVNISKITSVGTGAYTVTFAKKISGASESDIGEKGKAWWNSAEGTAFMRVVMHVGVDPSWEQPLAQGHK